MPSILMSARRARPSSAGRINALGISIGTYRTCSGIQVVLTGGPYIVEQGVTNIELLVIYKPDALPRNCTDEQARRISTGWTSVLRWLQGAHPHELPESDLVEHVARKAALRTPRHSEFSIALWSEQARSLERLPDPDDIRCGPLTDVGTYLLTSIGLERTFQHQAWLNRAAIELLYYHAGFFQANRDLLVRLLIGDPVSLERWSGDRLELAQAAKFVVRKVLSTQAISNLVHMDLTTSAEALRLLRTVGFSTAGSSREA